MVIEVSELTPRGRGAVAVIGVRGDGALARVRERLIGARFAAGELRVVELRSGSEAIDRALCWARDDADVELHVHGGRAVVERVIAALGGEVRGGADTWASRAARLLERAPCEAAARILLDQAQGALTRELARMVDLDGARWRQSVAALIERARVASRVFEPTRVVIAGPVNAGKSTLFNLLSGERRAIESPTAGTTRDLIEARGELGGYPVVWVDTAGERESSDDVERSGVRLAREARAQADLVLWLAPPGSRAPTIEGRLAALRSRADELGGDAPDALEAISAVRDPSGAIDRVARTFRRVLDLPERPWLAGQAVPFDQELVADLRSLAEGAEPEARGALLEPGRGPRSPDERTNVDRPAERR